MKENIERKEFLNKISGYRKTDPEPSVVYRPERGPFSNSSGEKPVRLGFVGIGGRGMYHLSIALGIEGVEVPAIAEIKPVRLYDAKRLIEQAGLPSPTLYDRGPEDFRRMCEEEDLDAVICSTSWEWHAPICLAAMRNNKNAVTEVPIVQTIDEAWELVETHEKTGKWATLGLQGFRELAVLNMIQKGIFGDIVHAENGYIHDLRMVKFTPEEEPWRLQYSLDNNGNLYPDHPMTKILPALDINHGDRFDYLVSMSSGAKMINDYAALNYGKDTFYAKAKVSLGDYNATLIRTVKGKMVTLNHDTNTPHPREDYRIQGTKGIFLGGSGGNKAKSRIFIEGVTPAENPRQHIWESAEKYLEEYAHPIEKNYNPPLRRQATVIQGHGAAGIQQTPMIWHRLAMALRANQITDWDVYDSVTSSVIIPLTKMSVADRCKPVDFPDFTKGKWKTRPRINLV